MSLFKTPSKDYDLLTTEFVCNKFGLAELFAEKFAAYNLKCSTALDAGCGAGTLSIYLAEQFSAKVTAIDINPQAVACCKRNVERYDLSKNISVMEGNFADLYSTFKENSFRLIVSNPPIDVGSKAEMPATDGTFTLMNRSKYQFLTNSWHDSRGLDLTDYILIAGRKLLTADGAVILICCDADGEPEEYVLNKADKYKYSVNLLCKKKIHITALGITSTDKNFVNGYIWSLLKK